MLRQPACNSDGKQTVPRKRKPKGRVNAFAFYIKHCYAEIKSIRDETFKYTEFVLDCNRRWKALADAEKQPFLEMAEKDKMRYNQDMKTYTQKLSKPEKQNKKNPTRKIMKQRMSAFYWFCVMKTPEVPIEFIPHDKNLEKIMEHFGKLWRDANPAVKAKCQEVAAKETIPVEQVGKLLPS